MLALAWVLAFATAFVLDYADTRHKIAVERRDGHAAGRWSVSMYLVGIAGTWAVLDYSHTLIVPTCLGLYVGSIVAMRHARRTDPTRCQG